MGDEKTKTSGLVPHLTRNTVSINEARRVIMQLAKPLADISQVICDNVYALEQQMKKLNRENQSLNDLKKNMYIPVIDLKETYFNEPRTVCADLKCTTTYTVQGKKKCHYSQLCHNPCYLRNVPREIIGSPELVGCAAMKGTNKCHQCGCDYGKHMHIYYETTIFETHVKDTNVETEITNKEAAIHHAQRLVQQMKNKKTEFEDEHKFILNSLAKFAWFLKNNAITAYNDAYKTYVGYLIDREKSLGDDADEFAIKHMEKALQQYEEYKTILQNAKNIAQEAINSSTISNLKQKLFNLKHNGQKIKSLYENQNCAHDNERENTEYKHESPLNLDAELSTPTTSTTRNRKKQTQKQQGNGQNRSNPNNQTTNQKQYQAQQQNKKSNYQNNNRQQNAFQRQTPRQQFYSAQQVPPPPQYQYPPYNNYPHGPPPPNFYNGPSYTNQYYGPPYNYQPGGGNQPNFGNPILQGYQNQQPQNPPPPTQQYNPQFSFNQQGPPPPPPNREFRNEAGPSKDTNLEAPTGVYKPKSKQNTTSDNTTMHSLEDQYSSLRLQDYDNRNSAPVTEPPNRNRNGRYNPENNLYHVHNGNNIKRRPRRHHTRQQERNHKSSDDEDNDDSETKNSNSAGALQNSRELRKNDLVREAAVALAVTEESAENATGVVNDISTQRAALLFFKKMFG